MADEARVEKGRRPEGKLASNLVRKCDVSVSLGQRESFQLRYHQTARPDLISSPPTFKQSLPLTDPTIFGLIFRPSITMSAMISSSMASIPGPAGCRLKPTGRCLGSIGLTNLSFRSNQAGVSNLPSAKRLTVRAEYGERSSSSILFVSGFVLGGIIVGAFSCVSAPQIRQAIAETDKKDLMRKLPKFIYDEDKALERKRKKLTEKIAQLNTTIDGVSANFGQTMQRTTIFL